MRVSLGILALALVTAGVVAGVTKSRARSQPTVADVRSGGGNGQQVVLSGVHQRSARICGTNQYGQSACTAIFNTSSQDTLYRDWWWVGGVTVTGWTQPNGHGRSLGPIHCEVPKVQLSDDRTECHTGW